MRCGFESSVPIREAEVAAFVRYRFLFWHGRKCKDYFGDQGDEWKWREIFANVIDQIAALLQRDNRH